MSPYLMRLRLMNKITLTTESHNSMVFLRTMKHLRLAWPLLWESFVCTANRLSRPLKIELASTIWIRTPLSLIWGPPSVNILVLVGRCYARHVRVLVEEKKVVWWAQCTIFYLATSSSSVSYELVSRALTPLTDFIDKSSLENRKSQWEYLLKIYSQYVLGAFH